jgi:Ca2+-binding RTX toxin-like protein
MAGWATNYLLGGAGDDVEYGGFGDDVVEGEAGNDKSHRSCP